MKNDYLKQLQELKQMAQDLQNQENPGLCSYCAKDCATYNEDWHERTGNHVFDTCMNKHIVLKGDNTKSLNIVKEQFV
tara:strand:+ start:4059 stop:4292 length:234 start_codon:yes stop_codon:yes gene_type:complete